MTNTIPMPRTMTTVPKKQFHHHYQQQQQPPMPRAAPKTTQKKQLHYMPTHTINLKHFTHPTPPPHTHIQHVPQCATLSDSSDSRRPIGTPPRTTHAHKLLSSVTPAALPWSATSPPAPDVVDIDSFDQGPHAPPPRAPVSPSDGLPSSFSPVAVAPPLP